MVVYSSNVLHITLTYCIRYPVEGYRPLQEPPNDNLLRAKTLLESLEKILPYFVQVRILAIFMLKKGKIHNYHLIIIITFPQRCSQCTIL